MIDVLTKPGLALASEDGREDPTRRTVRSKTYHMPDGTCKVLATMTPVHYKDDLNANREMWKDVDLTVTDEAGKKVVQKAAFGIEIYTDRVGYRYTSKRGGTVDVELVQIDGQSVDNKRFKVRTKGNQLFWDDVVDGVDMKVQLRPMSAEIFKKLANGNSPRRFKWKIVESPGSQAEFRKKSAGVDSAKPKPNILEMLNEVTSIADHSFYFEEEWTGRVAVRDRKTRQKRWGDDVIYPVIIDAFTSEVIVADVDDGWEFYGATTWNSTSNNWYAGISAALNTFHGGVRFRTLGVPQGATINNAVLKFNVTAVQGNPQTTIYGDDVNDAALWANGNLPSGITKTAGSANWSATTTGWNTIPVTSIVQTIISRPGWVSLNDIRFGVLNVHAATTRASVYVYDYQQGAVNPAVLEVTYTPLTPTTVTTTTTLPPVAHEIWPSLEEATALSVVYSDPIVKTPRTGFLGELRENMSTYQHVVSAWGGYDTATIRMAATQNDVDDWLEYGLGRHIEVYSPSLEMVWEGFANQVSASLGRASVTVGPLLDSANRVATIYSTVDTTVSPPIFGIRTKTASVNDTSAQTRYGIIEKIYSVGGATQTDAEQIRDTYIAENAWPIPTQALGETGGETTITLTCLGYVHWFKCYVYTHTANSGTQNLSAKMEAVIDAQLNAIIRSHDILANTLAVDRYEDDDKTAWDLLRGLTAMGDANDDRYLFGVYKQREAVYEAAPTTEVTYQQRLSDPSQRVELLTGTEVKPWDVLPGKWLFIPDFLIGKAQPLTLRTDPRYIFIERVTFTMPYGLNIQGGKVDTLPQKLARMGLGGVSA